MADILETLLTCTPLYNFLSISLSYHQDGDNTTLTLSQKKFCANGSLAGKPISF